MQSEILAHQEEQALPEELHEGAGKEVVMSGYGASKNVRSACSGDVSYGKISIEKADGSSGGEKRARLRCLGSWKLLVLKRRRSSLLWPPSLGQKGCGLENGQ